jgi:hypothetical protein
MLHKDESLELAPIKKGTATPQRIGIKDGKSLLQYLPLFRNWKKIGMSFVCYYDGN